VSLEFVVSDCGEAPQVADTPIPISASFGDGTQAYNYLTFELLSGRVGEAYSQSVAAQISGGVPPFRYLLLRRDGLLGVNLSTNGVLSGTPTPASAGDHRLRIQITDSCTTPRKFLIEPTINIVANPGFCTELALPSVVKTDGTVGVSFTQTIVVSGGKTPIDLNLSSGSLPPGLSLAGFTISGTPTAGGSFTFRLTAQDACDIRQSAFQDYRIDITDPDPCPDMNEANGFLPDGFVGTAYSQQLQVTGGVPPLTFALNTGSTLPDGLFIDANGLISGTPTIVTTGQAFSVNVTDSCVPPQVFLGTWSMEIQDGTSCPALSLSGTLPDATAGVDYDVQLNANGRPALTYTKVSGDLPFGLGLSSSGRIQGLTFDTGIYNFDVRVVDSCPAGAQELTRSMSLRVTGPSCANLAIVTFDLVQGFEGTAYSDFINILGGEGTLNFQVISGTLPAGLTLNQFGEIAGTATAAGTFNFTVEVTDSCAVTQVDQQAYQLIINGLGCPGMEIDGGDLPAASAGTPYSFTFEIFGGQGAVALNPYPGSNLPPGLSLDPVTGELSGTPTTAGTYFFDLEAIDECDPPQHAFRSVEMTIN
jgi:hypothetical protein